MKKKTISSPWFWIAFGVALLPRLLFLGSTYPISITGDELYAMWPAAKAMGYDWSGVMQGYRYYGYGFSMLWIPFMAVIKDPVLLYRAMVALMALCQALTAPVSYCIMKKYFAVDDEKIACLLAVACSYLVAVRATYTYPEFVYVLVVWLIVWVMCRLNGAQDRAKEKALYTAALFFLLACAYSLHSRALALWLAMGVTVVLYGWIYRKSYLSVPVCVVVGIPLCIAAAAGINQVLAFLGFTGDGTVGNTSAVATMGILEQLKNPTSWTAWADIVIGQFNESLILTGGLAAAVVVVMLTLIWKALQREPYLLREDGALLRPYILVGIFCICAVGITIGGQSVSWLSGVTNYLNGVGDEDSLRAITYLRYYGAYIGPLFLAGTAYIIQNPETLDNLKEKIAVIVGLLQGYWVLIILPVVCYSLGCVWSYAPFSMTKGFAVSDGVGIRSYLPGTMFIFLFLLLAWQLFRRGRIKILIGAFCVVLLYTYLFNGLYHERYRGEKNYQYTEAAVDWIKTAEARGADIEKIYVGDDAVPGVGQGTKFLYQYLMPEKQVRCEVPDGEEEAIYISHQPELADETLQGEYEKVKIAENTYVYIWGEELQKKLCE